MLQNKENKKGIAGFLAFNALTGGIPSKIMNFMVIDETIKEHIDKKEVIDLNSFMEYRKYLRLTAVIAALIPETGLIPIGAFICTKGDGFGSNVGEYISICKDVRKQIYDRVLDAVDEVK